MYDLINVHIIGFNLVFSRVYCHSLDTPLSVISLLCIDRRCHLLHGILSVSAAECLQISVLFANRRMDQLLIRCHGIMGEWARHYTPSPLPNGIPDNVDTDNTAGIVHKWRNPIRQAAYAGTREWTMLIAQCVGADVTDGNDIAAWG